MPLSQAMRRMWSHAAVGRSTPTLKPRLIVVYEVLGVLNFGAWLLALVEFHDHPVLLGIAAMVFGLGLRHAVDADHIAAIDNVTRKFMRDGKRPVSVGFFFAMGHSTVVMLIVAIVAGAASLLGGIEGFRSIGGTISTGVSILFLFAIAAMNIAIFQSVYRSYRRLRAGGTYVAENLDLLLNNLGVLSRVLRPLFHLITKSWHMFALGFLFGLGFDTATEIAMLSTSAAQAAQGVPLGTILIFPLLFAAGMALVDTTDGVLMLAAYGWAVVKPARRLAYNMIITLVSAVVALVIGGIEALDLIADKFDLRGVLWDLAAVLHDNFDLLGLVIVGMFLVAWALSYLACRIGGMEHLDVQRAAIPERVQ